MEVQLRDIHKTFGPVHANAGISLTIPGGSIQGILGENGAGKSTLMKILSGFIEADRGQIALDGKTATMRSPADAVKAGVGMLHQDPLDFPSMRVLNNLLIGPFGGVVPRRAAAREEILETASRLGFHVDLHTEVGSLTVGERQQLELVRLMWLGARVLILDEPTTGISAAQRTELFAGLRKLVSEGKTIIFVSHKLEEVRELCDRVAVLRQGRLVSEERAPFDLDQLVTMMFARPVSPGEQAACAAGGTVLRLQSLATEDHRLRLREVDLDVRGGEVIGLAGMEGSGQALFLKACAGLVPTTSGKILLGAEELTGRSYRRFLSRGVAYLPATRLEEGLVPGLTLTEHFLLAQKRRSVFIDWDKGRRATQERIGDFNIKGRPDSRVEALSGGNQQRVLLALVKPSAKLLLLEHPTRGLDIESTIYLWGKLKDRCRTGTAIMFISSDLEELLRYSDRIMVFFAGRVTPPMDAAGCTVEQLGQLIGGRGV